MIVTGRIAARIGLIVLAAVILQLAFFSFLSLFGATPNVVFVVIVALGLLGGAVVGAVCGFGAGLLVDSVLLETLGVSSLVLLSIGYLAGRYREGFEFSGRLTPPLITAGLALLAAAGFAAVQLMLGIETTVSIGFLREVILQGLFAGLLAIPIYPLIRRLLAPALIDYAPSRRLSLPRLRRSAPTRQASRAEAGGDHGARRGRPRAATRRRTVHGGRV